ncbi:GPI-anchored cell wall organization protein Ecm33 [Saccharata proteae CBS 121410]|uniref:GPI-anchored cell wall organization protein Ecm33 n=1 Tax=Saccharata proteae CBS 121410 TaxID=1314787 RepID=A0A9P4HQP3_9PEZI|nr:GPI-anchored cell wall organization protein Ecm33 [Saccharata proteae CBS 121410]
MLKYAVPLAAVAATAAAQSSCSIASTTTISQAAEASAFSACSTFSGSIAIATGASGDFAINGVKEITGSLYANNVSQLTSLSGDSLTYISNFELHDMTIMATLNFPQLSSVDTIDWSGLQALSGLSFSTGVTQANTVNIQNTFLSTLDGIDLKTVDTFYLANNQYLEDVTVQFTHIGQALTLSANGESLQASFPNLEWAYNMTFRNVSTISTPSLATLNGSLGFYGDKFKTYSAPNLTDVGGSLSFIGNGNLDNLTLPQLEKVSGGFQIADNPYLKQNLSFPALTTVGGALDFSGNFSGVSMPNLTDVRGGFNIQSSEDIDDTCSEFSDMHGSGKVIKGEYQCAGSQNNPGGADTTPTGTSSGSSSTKTGAAGRMEVSAGVGLMGVLAAMLGMF